MIVVGYWYGSDLAIEEVDMVLPRIESKKKREGPAGRAGTATQEKGLQDFSSGQEQARSNDRHVQPLSVCQEQVKTSSRSPQYT